MLVQGGPAWNNPLMEVSCPACAARYRIEAGSAAGSTTARARRARCTACGTIFQAIPPPAAEPEADEPPPPPDESEGEDVGEDGSWYDDKPQRRRWWPLPLAALLLLAALLAALIPLALLRPDWVEAATGRRPPTMTLPAISLPAISLPSIRLPRIELPRAEAPPLLIEARTVRRQLDDGRHAFEVKGSIRNPGQVAYALPPVELLLLDPAGRIVDRWTARGAARSLAPGEATRFESSNVDPPPTGVEVRVRLKPAELGRP